MHVANRIKHLMRGQRISRLAVDLRSAESRQRGSAPYFNHHPSTIQHDLNAVGLDVLEVLSVSNLRHPLAKVSGSGAGHARAVERMAPSERLARISFGPSAFFLLRKRGAAAV